MNSLAKPSLWWKVPTNAAIRWQSSASSSTEIQIPERIERSPTDILKALSRTVPTQRNLPSSIFQHDSFLNPVTTKQWREMALSKDAGRNTALWVKSNHGKCFPQDLAQPAIPMFNLRLEHKALIKMTEDDLVKLISESRVEEAVHLYKILSRKNMSIDTKLSLLELLCFHSGQETFPSTEFLCEKWYASQVHDEGSTFRYTPFMKNLFESLIKNDTKTASRAYNALICGASRHKSRQLVYELYRTCGKDKIPLNRNAYNSVLSALPRLKGNSLETVKELQAICSEMAMRGIEANIDTFNAILSSIKYTLRADIAIATAKSLYSDIKKRDLQCTLATHANLLLILMRDAENHKDDIREIIKAAATKSEYNMSHPDDCMFFSIAMKLTSTLLADREIGNLIHETLLVGENYKFLASFYETAFYYRHYLILMLRTSTFDSFNEMYDKVVPYLYQPEKQLFEHVIEVLQIQSSSVAEKYILKYWNDLVTFFSGHSPATTSRMIFLMCNKCDLSDDSPLHKEFGNAAWTLWNIMQTPTDKFSAKRVFQEAQPLGNIIVLLLRGGMFNEAILILTHMNTRSTLIEGVVSPGTIQQIFSMSLAQADSRLVFPVLQYVMKHDLPGLHQMVKKTLTTLVLTSKEETKLKQMIAPYIDPSTMQALQNAKEDESVKDESVDTRKM